MSTQTTPKQQSDKPTAEAACGARGAFAAKPADAFPHRTPCKDCYPDGEVDTTWVLRSTRASSKLHRSVEDGLPESAGNGGGGTPGQTALLGAIIEHDAVQSCADAHKIRDHHAVETAGDVTDALVTAILDDDRGQLHVTEYVMFGVLVFLAVVATVVLVVMGGGL